MLCRVGITTNWLERKAEWRRMHPSLRNWSVSLPYFSKSEAQVVETRLGIEHGCLWHWGGGDPERRFWYVYHFEYDPVEDFRLKNPNLLGSLYNFARLDAPSRLLDKPHAKYADVLHYSSLIDLSAWPKPSLYGSGR